MKKLSSVLAIGMVLAASSAFASDGTINITGEVSAVTCTINSGTKNITVNLPKVPTTALPSGQTAGRTQFQIALTGCTNSTGKSARAYFEPGTGSGVSAVGRLLNTGTATNVSLELLDSNYALINPNDNIDKPQSAQLVPLVSGAGTLTYYAQYYSFGTVTPGSVNASINYSIHYQ
ncbi:fimbrial protein [Vogesella amnigena]|uniref:Fimbrial protein n=1 Tax=Vogesella amnigena TaxID=1507449 RepID=A0ABV7TRY3_9NEIS